MKTTVTGLLCFALIATAVGAQPMDGDLVVSNFRDPTGVVGNYGPGSILSIDKVSGLIFTITPRFTTVGTVNVGPNWIEMATDNTNFMVPSLPTGTSATVAGNGLYLHYVDTAGKILRTLVVDTTPPTTTGNYINTIELDHDGTWLLAGGNSLWSFNEDTFTYSTLWTNATLAGQHNAFVIDRAPGGPTYVVGKFNLTSSTLPFMMGCDRSGLVTTIAAGNGGPSYISGLKIDRVTGDYISTGFGTTASGGGGEYMRTTKAGVLTTLNFPSTATTMYRANGIYIDKEHLAWILTYDWQTTPIPTVTNNYVPAVYKMDLQGVLLTMYIYSSTITRGLFAASGITEYGCRHVVCKGSGQPGTSVTVKFSSRKITDANKTYQLAASLGYTNGLKMPNGEYLDLFFDNLFLVTAKNVFPSIFKKFGGILDGNGEATATVNIPANIPPKLGIPIFVSGIVINPKAPGGISTVANTHWFVLD